MSYLSQNNATVDYYELRIYTNGLEETFNAVTSILGVQPIEANKNIHDSNPYGLWTYAIEVRDEDPYFDFINKFLDIIESKFEALSQLDIHREDITIWLLYEYDQQCNMEFHPQEMLRLGGSGIVLCISCWQS